jgi:hypothetical protein
MSKARATTYQLETLEKAAKLYEGLASGKFMLYNKRKYAFLEPEVSEVQDRALALRNLIREMKNGNASTRS